MVARKGSGVSTGNPIAESVGQPEAPSLVSRALRDSGMAFLEIKVPFRNSGITKVVQDDAFGVLLQLRAENDFDFYVDGKHVKPHGYRGGDIGIIDLRANVASDTRDPYHAVDFYLPRRALLAMGEDGDIERGIQELRQPLAHSTQDPVVRHLLLAMRPALAAAPEQVPELFVDHVATALAVHLARTYGGGAEPRQSAGGLSPWQALHSEPSVQPSSSQSLKPPG